MRNYAMTCAAQSQHLGASLPDLFHNWRCRRRLARNAAAMAPGFSREDIAWALSLPLSVNPMAALDDLGFRRSLR